MTYYADLTYYASLYADNLPTGTFNRLAFDACRLMDNLTTGVDGYIKLRNAFPEDEYNAETVKRAMCAIVHAMYGVEQAEAAANSAMGFVTRDDGTVTSKLVSSMSSGSESISFANAYQSVQTAQGEAVRNATVREQYYRRIALDALRTAHDANGVNLLYMGRYPNV